MKNKSALAFTLVLALMVTLAGCGDRNRLEWPNTTLGERLPNPPVKSGEITLETSDSLMADAFDASEKDYKNFVEDCKERGFTVDSKEEDYTFSAYDGDGYFIDIQYWESDEKISIIVRDSIEVKFAEFSWPKSDIASSVPVPKSNIGTISWDGEKSFLIYVGNTSKDDYAEYVDQCYGAGFTIDCSRRDEQFNGVNEDGYHLSVDYERNQTMSIRLYTADMLGEEPPTSVNTTPPQTEPNAFPSSSVEGQTDDPSNTENVPSNPSEGQEPQNTDNQGIEYAEVYFGSYEQDNDESNGAEDICWIVIDEFEGNSFLVSKYILDYQPFNDSVVARGTTWEHSSLRTFLNDSFFNAAFSDKEKQAIITTNVQDYGADHKLGEITEDYVFILSYNQAWSYFQNGSERRANLTKYAQAQEKHTSSAYWLIDSYSSDLYKYLVSSIGISENNPRVNEPQGVRPAIWVKNDAIQS